MNRVLYGMHRASCIVIFILICIVGCKAKEAPKITAPSQPAEVAIPSAETKESAVPAAGGAKLNQPPRVTSVDVTPNFPKIGDTLKITAIATDPDGDEVTFIYHWFKNEGLLPEETSDTLSLKGYQRGDRIMLNVIPYDGKEKGSPGVMKVTVGNSPPEIISSPSDNKFENGKFSCQVKAKDPENDQLVYSLRSAPPGMNIDKASGLINWDVPANFKGRAPVTVYVEDGNGGEAAQSFTFELNP